jgi:hypothetical protein
MSTFVVSVILMLYRLCAITDFIYIYILVYIYIYIYIYIFFYEFDPLMLASVSVCSPILWRLAVTLYMAIGSRPHVCGVLNCLSGRWFICPAWCWFRCPEVGASSVEWTGVGFLPGDGDRAQSAKPWF